MYARYSSPKPSTRRDSSTSMRRLNIQNTIGSRRIATALRKMPAKPMSRRMMPRYDGCRARADAVGAEAVPLLNGRDRREPVAERQHGPDSERRTRYQECESGPSQDVAPGQRQDIARVHGGHDARGEERMEHEERKERLPVRRVLHAAAPPRGEEGHHGHHDQVHDDDSDPHRMREEAVPTPPRHYHQEEKEEDIERDADDLEEWKATAGAHCVSFGHVPSRV